MEKSVNYNNYCWVQRKTSSSALKEKHETTSSPKCSIAKNSMRLVRGCMTCVNHKAVTRLGAALPSHSPESPADCRSGASLPAWWDARGSHLHHSAYATAKPRLPAAGRVSWCWLLPQPFPPPKEEGAAIGQLVNEWLFQDLFLFSSAHSKGIYICRMKKETYQSIFKNHREKKMASLHVTL